MFVPTTSLTLAIALFAAGSLTAPAIAADGENVVNGDFSNGTDPWFTAGNLTPTIVDGRLCVDVPGGTVEPVGRDRRPERHRPRPRRHLPLLLRRLVERRRQERARARRPVGRPVHRLLHLQRAAHDRQRHRRATPSNSRRRPHKARWRSSSAARPTPGRSASTTSRCSAAQRPSRTFPTPGRGSA